VSGPSANVVASAVFARALDRVVTGRSDAIAETKLEIACAAQSSGCVMISGEVGSGRLRIARLIHDYGAILDAPFVTIDCSNDAADRFDINLDACAGRQGVTAFLRDIAMLGPAGQDSLWQLFATPATKPRVITATRHFLHATVLAGGFREDLYYRLNMIHIRVPSLRHRPADVPVLVDHFLDSHAEKNSAGRLQVTTAAMGLLTSYWWPGNVRELREVVESATRIASGGMVRSRDLPDNVCRRVPMFGPEAAH
jgi:DNA-binding NtrC family response regulator